jgi:hypothetical protein
MVILRGHIPARDNVSIAAERTQPDTALATDGEGCEERSQWGERDREDMREEHVGGKDGLMSRENVCVVLGAAWREIAKGNASRD